MESRERHRPACPSRASKWVDFGAVKEAVSMERVLAHYGVRLKGVSKSYLRGRCPLPAHSSESSKESFGVNTDKNVWACQSASCVRAREGHLGGNVLDFVAGMENCSIREAALRIQRWFGVGGGCVAGSPAGSETERARQLVAERKQGQRLAQDGPIGRAGNAVLGFSLAGVNSSHGYLRQRGIQRGTAEAFGAGFYAGKGSLHGRVVIPIHGENGELVAYAGRALGDAEPKYRIPAGFKKSLVLFNLHRAVCSGEDRVVVVEGFFDCMKVHQAGFPCVVALMGAWLSNIQEGLLVEHFKQVQVMLDGDEAGRWAGRTIAARLRKKCSVQVVDLPVGQQPDQLSAEAIRRLIMGQGGPDISNQT